MHRHSLHLSQRLGSILARLLVIAMWLPVAAALAVPMQQ